MPITAPRNMIEVLEAIDTMASDMERITQTYEGRVVAGYVKDAIDRTPLYSIDDVLHSLEDAYKHNQRTYYQRASRTDEYGRRRYVLAYFARYRVYQFSYDLLTAFYRREGHQ